MNIEEVYNKVKFEEAASKIAEADEKEEDSKEEDSKEDASANKENATPEQIVKEVMWLEPSQVLKFIAKQYDVNAKEWLLKNIIPFSYYVVKNGLVKAKDLVKSAANIGKKNKEDDSDIDYDNFEIDENTIKTVYAFDEDSSKKLREFIELCRKDVESAKDSIEEKCQVLDKDIKKAGIKMDGEKLSNNALTVAGVIDNKENKGKSGKELTKIVDQRIESKGKTAEIEKKIKKIQQTIDNTKKDDSIEILEPKEIEKKAEELKKTQKENPQTEDVSKISDELQKKVRSGIAKDFKSSVEASIFKTKDFIESLKSNGFNDVKVGESGQTVAIRVDYYDDEASDVVEKEEKAGYKVEKLTGSEKNKGLKKITDYIEKQLKDVIEADKLGDIQKYRKYWSGDNPDGNFDQIYVFAEYK